MTEFFQSIKSDLLSRRLLPLLALLGVLLLAAVAYAVTGGSAGKVQSSGASQGASPANGASTLPVTVAQPNPNEAVSETPGGMHYQSQGPTRDPFTPLPSPPAAKAASKSSSSSSTGKGSSSSSSTSKGSSPSSSSKPGGSSGSGGSANSGSGSSSGGTAPSTQNTSPAPTPKKASKPPFPYDVSVLFGLESTTPGQPATLTPYKNLKLLQALPSAQDARISFERVTKDGQGVVFKLLVAPIVQGAGVCLPSNSECQALELETGKTEELEYLEASGQPVVYELKVLGIAKKSESANAAHVRHRASK